MKVFRNILGEIYRSILFYIFKYRVLYKNNVRIDRSNKISFDKNCLIIGDGVTIGAFNVIYAIKSSHSKINGQLIIGEATSIGEFNNIRAAGGKISIGKNCLISQHVSIIASNHNIKKEVLITEQGWDETKTGVDIGDDVWVGANTVILPGVSIGTGSVIAAGCVVTKNVPNYSIVAGIPGKIIEKRV